jgi:inorganic triphosphatase YgiF
MQPVPREIELKLAFDPAEAGRLKRHLGHTLTARKPKRQTLVSVYFDTPDQTLREAGVSLRVRRVGRRLVQTVKSGNGASAGLFDRGEWEHQIGRMQPDLDAAKDTPLAPLIDSADALRPVFESRILRTVYAFESDGSDVEVSFDQGHVDNGSSRAPVYELELELKRGEPAALFRLARELSEVVRLRFAVASKADRGYALTEDSSDRTELAADVHLLPSMSCAAAFKVIAHGGLRQVAVNEPQVCAERPSALHQMRIGLRRVRAAMSVFKNIVNDNERDGVRDELKWLASMLGPARDLDVFMTEVLLPLRQDYPDDPGFADIIADVEQRRLRAYADAVAACRSDRYQALLLNAVSWIESGPWRIGQDALQRARREQPIATLATDELSRRLRAIVKKGKNLRDCGPGERHKVRICGKKLRYAAEFFADVFPGKRNARRRDALLSGMKDLQESLGGLNDIVTRTRLASQIARASHAGGAPREERAFAAGLIVGRQDGRRRRLLDAAEKAYDAIADCKPYWN